MSGGCRVGSTTMRRRGYMELLGSDSNGGEMGKSCCGRVSRVNNSVNSSAILFLCRQHQEITGQFCLYADNTRANTVNAVGILLHYWFYAHNGVNTRAKKGSNGAMNP